MLTPKIKEMGNEQQPYLEDSQGQKSYAPVRFFCEHTAADYANFAAERNIGISDARQAVWPDLANWKK
jgi:hypothetical protein